MKKIATIVALFTAVGSGAALAQGAPPGFAPWHSGWPGYVESHQAPGTSAALATTRRQAPATPVARNGSSAPVVGYAERNPRKG
jgi:hypothetical protein